MLTRERERASSLQQRPPSYRLHRRAHGPMDPQPPPPSKTYPARPPLTIQNHTSQDVGRRYCLPRFPSFRQARSRVSATPAIRQKHHHLVQSDGPLPRSTLCPRADRQGDGTRGKRSACICFCPQHMFLVSPPFSESPHRPLSITLRPYHVQFFAPSEWQALLAGHAYAPAHRSRAWLAGIRVPSRQNPCVDKATGSHSR
ncbi:uncharacterized protein J3D65DRAFT_625467 [Phyllosticta citribraziliensis]|uniref:Uncharacterized protein n=1 Tax=Phyllosticta citribraziliensis TaxID=989973 RepID=A0ABR1LTP3_9PEZI